MRYSFTDRLLRSGPHGQGRYRKDSRSCCGPLRMSDCVDGEPDGIPIMLYVAIHECPLDGL